MDDYVRVVSALTDEVIGLLQAGQAGGGCGWWGWPWPAAGGAMDDSETEAAETEPLVRRQSGTAAPTGGGGGTGTTVVTRGEGGRQQQQQAAAPIRGHTHGRPRLSLVPETSEKSTDDDNTSNEQQDQRTASRGDTDRASPSRHQETPTRVCPFFGVKNYLHHFYEKPDLTNAAALYEDYRPVRTILLSSFINWVIGGHLVR